MQFDEGRHGDFLIQAGALDSPGQEGYTASVVVSKRRARLEPPGLAWQEVWRDEDIMRGRRWLKAQDALAQAMGLARSWVQSQGTGQSAQVQH
jgi:hypothetical protein